MRAKVFEAVSNHAFAEKLIDNGFRGVVAEGIVKLALSQEWNWPGDGWAGWDLEHHDGTRLEVKQSAAR